MDTNLDPLLSPLFGDDEPTAPASVFAREPKPRSARTGRPVPPTLALALVAASALMLAPGRGQAQAALDPDDPAEEARPPEARFAIGAQLRNGDWFVIEPLALIWLAEPGPTIGLPLVATARGVLGVGGSGGAIGFGTGLGTTCATRGRCKLRDSMFSSIVDIEAAVERTYGGTTWRHATYMGPRLSSGGTDFKWSAGWMFDLDGGSNHHFQFGAGIGW